MINRQLFDYFYQVRMNGGHGNGYHSLYLHDHTTVTRTLYFQKDTLLSLKVTACDTDFSTFRQIQLFWLKVKKVVIITAGHSDEVLHLHIGNDNFLPATGIGDVLQIGDLRLDTLHFRRTGMDEYQVMDNGDQRTDFLSFTDAYLVLHGNKTAQFLFFKKTHSIRFSAVCSTHGVPNFSLVLHYFQRVSSRFRSEKSVPSGL